MDRSDEYLQRLLAGLLVCLVLMVPLGAAQDAPVRDNVDQAIELIAMRQYAAAIDVLRATVDAEPNNAVAWLFLARAQNCAGQYSDAAGSLLEVDRLGIDTPMFHRELGITLGGAGADEDAWAELQKADPDDPEAQYAMGLLALRLDKFDEAMAAFRRAAEDPLFAELAEQQIVMAERATASAEIEPVCYDDCRWRFQFGLTIGYDDNVTLFAEEAVADPSQRADAGSWFITVPLAAGYELWTDGTNRLEAVGAFSETLFPSLEQWGIADGGLGLALSRRTPMWVASISPSVQCMWLDHSAYRTRLVVPVSAERKLASCCSFGATYRVNFDDFDYIAAPNEELDGVRHHVDIGPRFRTPCDTVTFRVVGTWDTSRPTGEYMQYDALGTMAGMQVQLLEKWRLDTFLAYRHPRYKHPTPRFPGMPIQARSDWEGYFRAELVYDVAPNRQIVLTYSRLNNSSNIPRFYEYDQDHVAVTCWHSF